MSAAVECLANIKCFVSGRLIGGKTILITLCGAILAISMSAEADEIYVENECFFPVDIAIRYLDEDENRWKTEYWWHFDAYEEAYLADDGKRLQTENDVVYYYAVSTMYNRVWEGDDGVISDRKYEVGEEVLHFKRYEDGGYDVDITLSCSNIVEPMVEKCRRRCSRNCFVETYEFDIDSEGNVTGDRSHDLDPQCVMMREECMGSCLDESVERWKLNNRE